MAKLIWFFISLFILYGVLIPFNLIGSTGEFFSNFAGISWIPFVDPDGSRASIPDVVQNILLFLPFGFAGFFTLTQLRKSVRIPLVTGIGTLYSGIIEFSQLCTINRTTSTTDLATNTIGAFLGAVAAYICLSAVSHAMSLSAFKKYRRNKYLFPLLVSGALVLFGTLQPFDFTLDVGSVWPKIRRLLLHPLDFSWLLRDEAVVYIRFVLLSYVTIRFLKESEFKQSIVKGILVSMAIGICLESSQIMVASRMPSIQDNIVVLTGSLSGGLLAVFRNSMRLPQILWFSIFLGAIFFSASVQLLSPFRLADEFRSMNLIPFLPYYERTTFTALSNAIESLLMFFPLGFWGGALLPSKIPRALFLVLAAMGVAIPLEFAQGWISGRIPDITDILGAMMGTICGYWIFSAGWNKFNN